MIRSAAVAAASLLLVAGCSTSSSTTPPVASSTGGPTAATPNGTVYTVLWEDEILIATHSIAADGTLGPPVELLSAPDGASFPGVVDGLGSTGLLGTFSDYWTASLQVYVDAGLTAQIDAPEWCGGEGLTYNLCVLVDDSHVARTTELGRDPVSGEGAEAGSIIVTSLADGSTTAEHGPIADLVSIVGTAAENQLILIASEFTSMEEAAPSTVLRMDLADGTTTEIGTSPPGWAALCAIGTDSVLGFTTVSSGAGPQSVSTAAVVGPAEIADISWDDQDAVGCSADGRFLYLHRLPRPPSGEDDREAPNPPTSLDRVRLADGQTDPVLVLNPGVQVSLITR